MFKNYLKCCLYLGLSLIILTLIISLMNTIFNKNFTTIKLIIPIISILGTSIILGRKVKEKAYLEGLKFSSIYLIIITIIKIILKQTFSYQTFIIYFLMLLAGIIGSMIGINLRKQVN